MNITIRPYKADDDEKILCLENQFTEKPYTLESLNKERDRRLKLKKHILFVAEIEDKVVGTATVFEDDHGVCVKGFLRTYFTVDKTYQNLGIGRQMETEILKIIAQWKPIGLETYVLDNDQRTFDWIVRRGFTVERHLFASALDLTSYDFSFHEKKIGEKMRDSIKFVSMQEINDEESWDRLYKLYYESEKDDPSKEVVEENVSRNVFNYYFRELPLPEQVIVAVQGNEIVGFTSASKRSAESVYTNYTGVKKNWRGRGIAYALKHQSAKLAFESGYGIMRTHNDSKNQSMLKINEKLGYRPEQGGYIMYKYF